MKKTILLLAVIISIVSCKKENTHATISNTTPASVNQKRIVKEVEVTNDGNTYTSEYKYDAQGRLIYNSSDSYEWIYSYPSASSIKVTQKSKSNGEIAGTSEYALDAKGRVTKYESKAPAGYVISTQQYDYDAAGYINKWTITYAGNQSYYFEYTINNGNYTEYKKYEGGVMKSHAILAVDESKTVNFTSSFVGPFPSTSLFGNTCKNFNPVTKIYNASGTLTWHTEAKILEMNAAGYITKMSYKNMLSNYESTTTYYYE